MALLVSIVKKDFVTPIRVLTLDRSGVEFTSILELGLAFVPFANLRRALRAPRAAPRSAPRPRSTPTYHFDSLQVDVRLFIPILKGNVVRIITVGSLDGAFVPLTSPLEITFDLIAFAGLLRAPAAVALAVGVRALDELLLDPRLVLAVVLCGTVTRYLEDFTYVCDIIGAVAPITANLAGIELTSAACEL